MKLNFNSVIAIIVVLAFFGSMLAMAFNPNAPMNETPEKIPQQTIAQITYLAETDANVYMLENLYLLYATTNEGDITKIDNEIMNKLDLKKINSYFNMSNELSLSQGLTYIANIATKDTNQLYEKIETIKNIENILFLKRFGSVAIPKTLQGKNSDLNITKEIEMEKTLIDCVLEKETLKGQNIQIMISIITQGQQIIRTKCVQITEPLQDLNSTINEN